MLNSMDGVRFHCQTGCTNCCRVQGYVYLTQADLDRAAAFVNLSSEAFEKRYIYRTKHLIRLRKPQGSQCHFLEAQGCSIHPAKPTQCRLFPFWPDLIESASSWVATGARCPGIGKGPYIQIGTAVETASEMKRAYPTMY